MRKLHDISSASLRAPRNSQKNSHNNNNNTWSSPNSNAIGNSLMNTSASTQLPLSPTSHLTNLNHHHFAHMMAPHQRIPTDYPSPFMISASKQRLDATPFIAKVF